MAVCRQSKEEHYGWGQTVAGVNPSHQSPARVEDPTMTAAQSKSLVLGVSINLIHQIFFQIWRLLVEPFSKLERVD